MGISKRGGVARSRGLSPRQRQDELIGWLCVSPWVIGFVLLTAGPMLVSLALSFCKADMMRPTTFVGLENYQTLFSTSEIKSLFWKSLFNTSYFVFFSVPAFCFARRWVGRVGSAR